jgi:glycosyltransferase involved in cell wall biosynthesis
MISTGLNPLLPNQVGAIEPYVYGLSRELSCNHSVDVFGSGTGNEFAENLHVETLTGNLLTMGILKNTFGHDLATGLSFNVSVARRMLNLHRHAPFDIAHVHTIYSWITAAVCRSVLNIPVVCSMHNGIRTTLPLIFCNKILANSHYIKDLLISRGADRSKVGILPIAVDPSLFCPSRSTVQLKRRMGLNKFKIVLFVGRKCPEKGPLELVEALSYLVRKKSKVIAIFIGPDYFFGCKSKSFTEVLLGRARKLGIQDRTLFLDHLPDEVIKHYYDIADIVVVPSVWGEPFGKVIIEALSFEKPVVATAVGGIPEILQHGKNGLLVPPRDPMALGNAIDYLLENADIAKDLGLNGRETVLKKYSFKVVAKQCADIYERLVQ